MLPSGDVTEGVVRVGETVRRPHQDTSDGVAEYLAHLAQVGFVGAPRYLGRDAQGRDVLSYLDGVVVGDPVEHWAAVDDVLPGVAALVRRLHDASEGWVPASRLGRQHVGRPVPPLPEREPRLVSHRDVTPQNVVFRGGQAFGLIDFDLVGWTTRSLDLANTAMHWIPLRDPRDREPVYAGADVARRLRLILEAYGTDRVSPQQLLDAAQLRFGALYDSMRWNAQHLGGGWARMWSAGVGEVIRRRADWFSAVRDELAHALG